MKKNRGFTLIEVMVAVGVIAIALPALLLTMMAQIDSTAHLRDKLQAQWVAENVLAGIRIQNRLDGKVADGENAGSEELGGRKWYWKTRSKVFPQEEFSDIYGVEVSVWANEADKSGDALIQLVGILRAFNTAAVKMPKRENFADNKNTGGGGGSGSSGGSGNSTATDTGTGTGTGTGTEDGVGGNADSE